MDFKKTLSLSNEVNFTNKSIISQENIEGATTVVGKALAGRAGVLFLILTLFFISMITKVRPIFIIFLGVISIGLLHQEIFDIYVKLSK